MVIQGRQVEAKTYTLDEVIRLLQCGRSTAYAQAKKGEIVGVRVLRVGARYFIPKAALDRVLNGESGGNADPGDSARGQGEGE